ncbi:MAG TPA: SDR family oxidoreductase [Nocardioidaceae bacterium]|nr:SDR family oxidoreductase [Nocardioidaceae bacterium]
MSDTKAALVTGVGRRRGIGAAIALALAEDGWDVALSYWHAYDDRIGLGRSGDDLDRVVEEVEGLGRRVATLPADLERPEQATALVDDAAARLGPLTGMVLSHCESVDSGILDTSVASFDRHYAVNVRASWLLVAGFARQLPPDGGRVVALTSDHTVGNLPYGATKGALDRVVVAAAHELADHRLLANVVNPGPVDTGWMDDETRAALVARQPTGRLGTAKDTADLVRFLMSERGGWVNGQLLHSNGGAPLQ